VFRLLRKVLTEFNHRAGMSVQRTYLYRIARQGGWSAVAANNQNLTWELLSPERVDLLEEIVWFKVCDGLKRLRRGDLCYTVCIDGHLAHCSWVQRSGSHPITEAGVSVRVGSGEFWIYDCCTPAWARGQGIYPATLQLIINDHFEAGYCTAWIYTSRENLASQKGILRAGFGLVGTSVALRVGSRYYRIGRANRGQSFPVRCCPKKST
jgi:RimJ/RimL family protein N-acetyltransferase